MGDDVLDLPVLARVGLAAAPADAVDEVRSRVHWVSQSHGGAGAARELVELILRAQGRWEALLAVVHDRGAGPAGMNAYAPLLAALVALLAGLTIGKAWERYKLRDGKWIDRRPPRGRSSTRKRTASYRGSPSMNARSRPGWQPVPTSTSTPKSRRSSRMKISRRRRSAERNATLLTAPDLPICATAHYRGTRQNAVRTRRGGD